METVTERGGGRHGPVASQGKTVAVVWASKVSTWEDKKVLKNIASNEA